jgi:hypothetical protein
MLPQDDSPGGQAAAMLGVLDPDTGAARRNHSNQAAHGIKQAAPPNATFRKAGRRENSSRKINASDQRAAVRKDASNQIECSGAGCVRVECHRRDGRVVRRRLVEEVGPRQIRCSDLRSHGFSQSGRRLG